MLTLDNKARIINTVSQLLSSDGNIANMSSVLIQRLLDTDGESVSIGLQKDSWNESDHPRDKNGRFTSGGGEGRATDRGRQYHHELSEKGSGVAKPSVRLSTVVKSNEYVNNLAEAKASLPASQAPWRVTQYVSGDQFDEWHPEAKKYRSPGGSTVAVTSDGDIVGVCHFEGDSTRGKDLIAFAVANGGKKLDAYEGLFGFYTKCGFEPVSWCKWDDEFAPPDWRAGEDSPEHIVFYKYTGERSKYGSVEDFFADVAASSDYDAARIERDNKID